MKVVSESSHQVLQGVSAQALGELMNASHASLRDNTVKATTSSNLIVLIAIGYHFHKLQKIAASEFWNKQIGIIKPKTRRGREVGFFEETRLLGVKFIYAHLLIRIMLHNPTSTNGCTSILPLKHEIERVALSLPVTSP